MEVMRLGCIIVSDELPPSRWYEGAPFIRVRDWFHVRDVVNGFIQDPARMLELHQKTLDWWERRCSDEAVARYLAEEILRLMAVRQE